MRPARLRTKKVAKQKFRQSAELNQEVLRRRKATANRNLTVLRAALNHAWHEDKISSDSAWRRVRPFPADRCRPYGLSIRQLCEAARKRSKWRIQRSPSFSCREL